jgi:hypothetical protein
MAKNLGINMINMYVGLIEEEFKPIIQELESQAHGFKEELEIQVKKDFGIYELYAEKYAIEKRLDEIKDKLLDYERDQWIDGQWQPRLKAEVARRLEKSNVPLHQVKKDQNDLIKKIKLCGAIGDIQDVFNQVSETVAGLKANVLSLTQAKDPYKLAA